MVNIGLWWEREEDSSSFFCKAWWWESHPLPAGSTERPLWSFLSASTAEQGRGDALRPHFKATPADRPASAPPRPRESIKGPRRSCFLWKKSGMANKQLTNTGVLLFLDLLFHCMKDARLVPWAAPLGAQLGQPTAPRAQRFVLNLTPFPVEFLRIHQEVRRRVYGKIAVMLEIYSSIQWK